MTRQPPSGADIPASLAAERAAVEALVATLATERKALGAGNIDHLEHAAPRKRELLMAVAAADEQRNRLLERSGAGTGRRGMEAWLHRHTVDPSTRENWRALLDLTERARRLNEENGAFISAGLQANQQALSALLTAARSSSVYGPGGRTLNPVSSRPLASA
jgi:flagellar biosynthesis/type III secretory pathway chaperone